MHRRAKAWAPSSPCFLVSSSIAAHIGIIGPEGRQPDASSRSASPRHHPRHVFISGQIYEWFNLFDEGLNAKVNAYGSTFFVITGFHGAHVIVGLCMLGRLGMRALRNDFTADSHLFADAAVLYWHFVDFIWIFVFSILYLSV